jgi:hypothetical protein
MPLTFKERLDGCSDLYAKIRHAAMVDGKLHFRAIDDQMKFACSGAANSSIRLRRERE